MTEHLPDWAQEIYMNSMTCPSLSLIITEKEFNEAVDLDFEEESGVNCLRSQLVAEYLGWTK